MVPMVNARTKGKRGENQVKTQYLDHMGIRLKRDLEQWRSADHGDLLPDFQDGDFDWSVNSQFTGVVEMTDFIPPEGYFIHYESTRLLPNFATGQASSNSYPREGIIQGGVYPGMSNLNTLEVYMDISWSAPCAGVVGCVEQEA